MTPRNGILQPETDGELPCCVACETMTMADLEISPTVSDPVTHHDPRFPRHQHHWVMTMMITNGLDQGRKEGWLYLHSKDGPNSSKESRDDVFKQM